MPRKPKKLTVNAELLAKLGQEAFPDVNQTCVVCRGSGGHVETVYGLKSFCGTCRGRGEIVREMTAREEHYWILHLISETNRSNQTKFASIAQCIEALQSQIDIIRDWSNKVTGAVLLNTFRITLQERK